MVTVDRLVMEMRFLNFSQTSIRVPEVPPSFGDLLRDFTGQMHPALLYILEDLIAAHEKLQSTKNGREGAL